MKSRTMMLAVCWSVVPSLAWAAFPNGYTYRRAITIDGSKVSGGSALVGFPVAFSSTLADLMTVGQGGKVQHASGFDILFASDANGTSVLNFEIEKFDGSTGQLIAWVQIPSLAPAVATTFYMFYGKSGLSSSPANPSGVWDGYYRGVWHLKESGAPYDDASSYNNNGGSTAPPSLTGGGVIDGAQSFDRAALQHLSVADNSTLDISGPMTLESWVKIDNYGAYHWIASKRGPTVLTWDLLFHVDVGNRFHFQANNGTTWQSATWGSSPTPGTWYYVVAQFDGTRVKISVDGANWAEGGTLGSIQTNNDPLNFGRVRTDDYFSGDLDEIRLSATARSIDWLKTCYNSQSSPATFYNIGTEAATPTAFSLSSPADLATVNTARPTFTWTSSTDPGGGTISYTLKASTTAAFTEPVAQTITGITGTSYTLALAEALADTSYYWKVIATNGTTSLDSTQTRQLTVDTTPPAKPTVTGLQSDVQSGTITRLFGSAGEVAGVAAFRWDATGEQFVAVPGVATLNGGNFTFDPTTPLSAGATVYIQVSDSASNTADSDAHVLGLDFSRNVFQDTTVEHTVGGAGASLRLEGTAVHRFKVAVTGGQSMTLTAYTRYNTAYGSAAKPAIHVTGLGLNLTDTMTGPAEAWEQLSVTGTPNADGVLTLEVTTAATAASAAAWLDDVQVSQ